MVIGNLVKHNKYVLITILTEWLIPEEFGRFDSAVTNQILRADFQTVVTLHHLSFQSFILQRKEVPLSYGMLQWITQRGFNLVKFPKVCVTNGQLRKICLLTAEDKRRLFSFAFNAEELKIDRCSSQYVAAFADILSCCENLKTLKITNAQSCDSILKVVASSCSILTKCDLSGCRNIAETTVIQLCRSCLLLRDLNVIDCHELTSHFMRCVTIHCPMLVVLRVNGCYRITRRDLFLFYMMFRGQLESVDHVSSLTSFHVRLLSCYRGHTLKKFKVGASLSLTDNAISLLAVACCKLTEIDISGCRGLTSAGMVRFAGYMKTLVKLWTKNVSIDDEGLLLLLENNPGLLEISLSNNILTSESLTEIGKYCPGLITLSMVNIMLTEDDFISTILKCKHLQNLCIDSNSLVTDNAFAAVAVCCTSIKTITASCNRITDVSLCAFAEHCRHLTQLDINHCYAVTDKGIAVLLEWCRNMIDLRITNCDNLTGITLQKCSVFGCNLSVLRTSIKTKKLSTVLNLIDKLKRLRYFSMYLLVDDLMTVTRHGLDVNPDLRIAVYDE